MKRRLLEVRIPSLFAISLLLLGITLLTGLIKQKTQVQQNASLSSVPINITISNINSDSLTISYTTSDKATGTLEYGIQPNLGSIAYDTQDKNGKEVARNTHYFKLNNLTAQTMYYFTIISQDKTYKNNNSAYTAKTIPSAGNNLIEFPTISGKILATNGSPASNIVVYLTSSLFLPLSTLTNDDGSFTISLTNARDQNGGLLQSISQNDIFSLSASNGLDELRVTSFSLKTNPLPPLVLSNNYSFANNWQNNNPLKLNTFPKSILHTKLLTSKSLSIVIPSNKQSFTDPQPRFSGTAVPNAIVEITIHSDAAIIATTSADNSGVWIYRVSKALDIGSHTIIAASRNASGTLATVEQQFTILPPGMQVEGAATSSAEVTPTSTPFPTPTQATEITDTPTPSIAQVQSAISPTYIMTPTPTYALPSKPTGSNSLLLGGVLGSSFAILGIFLFLLTRGTIPKI